MPDDFDQAETTGPIGLDRFMIAKMGNIDTRLESHLQKVSSLFSFNRLTIHFKRNHNCSISNLRLKIAD